MSAYSTKIIIIHDDLGKKDPLIVLLKDQYGSDNVILFNKSHEGLEYVLSNLYQKMIVILDLNFKPGEPSGVSVFEDIRSKTSLVYIIIMTASDIGSINNDDLIKFVNHDALALLKSTDDTEVILNKVSEASHKLDTAVSSALEQWILKHPLEKLEEPYISTRDGKTYTLKQILAEIRKGSDFGLDMERKIITLAIDMLARGKKQVDA